MAKLAIYNTSGKKIKDKEVNDSIFGVPIKAELVSQVLQILSANQRQTLANTKGRSEVRGGGRKPWRQKGTGRARHGSIRSPLWAGGGVTFGPTTDRNFSKKINKKVKQLALFMVLSDKLANQAIFAVDNFSLAEIKTKKIIEILNNLPVKNKKTLVVLPGKDEKVMLSARNLPDIKVVALGNMNLLDLVGFPYLLMTEATVNLLQEKYSPTS